MPFLLGAPWPGPPSRPRISRRRAGVQAGAQAGAEAHLQPVDPRHRPTKPRREGLVPGRGSLRDPTKQPCVPDCILAYAQEFVSPRTGRQKCRRALRGAVRAPGCAQGAWCTGSAGLAGRARVSCRASRLPNLRGRVLLERAVDKIPRVLHPGKTKASR